jgi:cell division ATPase FtsA
MESGKHEMLKRLASNIDKKLGLIIPYENSIKDLVNELSDTRDYMAINIGNAKTTIVVVRSGEILATNYFNIGIGELIDDISKSYKVTNIKAIKTIDTDGNYNKEKLDFYKIWEQALKITLESTL